MLVPPPDPGGAFPHSRRLFLGACSILGLSLAACRSVGPRTSFAARMIADPSEREYRPVLRHLARTILPFEDARFPVRPEAVERRLLDLFPIDDGDFLGLQRALTFFDDLDLFPHLFGPLVRAEARADPASRGPGLSEDRVAELRAEEEAMYRRFRSSLDGAPRRFTELPREAQRDYLRLWGASGLTTKRQFARSVKSLVMITAYSTDELWDAIGYGGPVLEVDRASH